MLPKELMQQIRQLEIRTTNLVEEITGGAYHSVFKGRGIEFDEVREYAEGDDIRDIDWNVTARMNTPYIKKYIEERQLNVLLLVDLSDSGDFGSGGKTKRQMAVEVAALLAFSAIGNQDKVGTMLFTDEVEYYLPPRSGRKHTLRLIREILTFQPGHSGTDIDRALQESLRLLNQRSVIFLISDFLDSGSLQVLNIANCRHDVIAVRISDPAENSWPIKMNIMLEDAESGQLCNFSARQHRPLQQAVHSRDARLEEMCRQAKVDMIELSTIGEVIQPVIQFFRRRRKRIARGR